MINIFTEKGFNLMLDPGDAHVLEIATRKKKGEIEMSKRKKRCFSCIFLHTQQY